MPDPFADVDIVLQEVADSLSESKLPPWYVFSVLALYLKFLREFLL